MQFIMVNTAEKICLYYVQNVNYYSQRGSVKTMLQETLRAISDPTFDQNRVGRFFITMIFCQKGGLIFQMFQ